MKKGLEILGISIVDADVKDAVFLKGELRHRSGVPGLQSHQPFPRCEAVHRPNSMSGSQQGDTCVCFQHVTLFHQRGEGLCQAGKHQPFRRLDKNLVAQCCNGGSIYCNIR